MIIDKSNIEISHFINATVINKGKTQKQNKSRYFSNVFPHATIKGEILEFGVWQGHSISKIANYFNDQIVYGFDSFEGLPEDWFMTFNERHANISNHPKGHFGNEKLIENIPTNVKLIKGFFNKSLPQWLNSTGIKQIKLLHVDSDLYSSAVDIFENLNSFIVPGTVILFDELYPWVDISKYELWEEGEWKALCEWINKYDREFEIICRNTNQQAAIKVIK